MRAMMTRPRTARARVRVERADRITNPDIGLLRSLIKRAAVDPHDAVGIPDRYSFDVRFLTEIERFDRHLGRGWRSITESSSAADPLRQQWRRRTRSMTVWSLRRTACSETSHRFPAMSFCPFSLWRMPASPSVPSPSTAAALLMLSIVAGLTVGKPLGFALASALAVGLHLAERPRAYTWRQLTGAGALAGVGFTMSLFIAAQAFPCAEDFAVAKIAVFAASMLSAVLGTAVLWRASA